MSTSPRALAFDNAQHAVRLPAEQHHAPAANAPRFAELPTADSSEPPELQPVVMRGYN